MRSRLAEVMYGHYLESCSVFFLLLFSFATQNTNKTGIKYLQQAYFNTTNKIVN